jgi:conjugal transfer pilus assembly protein TraE
MKLSSLLNQYSATVAENRLLKFAVVIIAVVTVINTCLLYVSLSKERTIVVPPVIDTRFEIRGNVPSEDYIKMMTRYVVSLVLNYTPFTARKQMDEALKLFAPGESYIEAKRMFYSLADTVETAKVTNVFHVDKISVDASRGTIEVQGSKTQVVNEQKTKEQPSAVYLINYRVENARFLLTKFYPKNEG